MSVGVKVEVEDREEDGGERSFVEVGGGGDEERIRRSK